MPISSKGDIIAGWAEIIAGDDSHGYSQSSRWGNPDMDCSALCILAAESAGFPIRSYGGTYTGNMVPAFTKAGFKILPYQNSMVLKRGDILLNVKNHAAVYIGNNKLVEATGDEKGGISGGQPGDQTGHEIHIRYLYNYPWNYVLRYEEGADIKPAPDQEPDLSPVADPACSYSAGNAVIINGPQLRYKDYGPAVAAAQGALNYHGFGPLSVNGFFSSNMVDSVKRFQTVHQLSVDGIIGPVTWRALLYWR